MTKCYACKRELTNPTSVNLGIGPVCRAKRRREIGAQERLDREATKCHFGFVCYNPVHVLTLLSRLKNSMENWPRLLEQERQMASRDFEQDEVKAICQRVTGHIHTIVDCLGLGREKVKIPKIDQVNLETMLQTTGHFLNPANEVEPGTYRIPPDIERQYNFNPLSTGQKQKREFQKPSS